jgi:membrane peptidoglycan carboxypeptidase
MSPGMALIMSDFGTLYSFVEKRERSGAPDAYHQTAMPSPHRPNPSTPPAPPIHLLASPADGTGLASIKSSSSPGRWAFVAAFVLLATGFGAFHGLPRIMELPAALDPSAAPNLSLSPSRTASLVARSSQDQPESEPTAGVPPYREIPSLFLAAMVATQDPDFWSHGGTEGGRVLGAMADSVVQRRFVSGGSTITQQLAKITAPGGRPRSAKTWLVDAFTARRIELSLTKEQILEQYCARLPFGNGHVGLEAAARGYFHKSASDLTLAESAFLAGLPDAPMRHDPYHHFDTAKVRQKTILDRLASTGQISVDEARRAAAAKLPLAP